MHGNKCKISTISGCYRRSQQGRKVRKEMLPAFTLLTAMTDFSHNLRLTFDKSDYEIYREG